MKVLIALSLSTLVLSACHTAPMVNAPISQRLVRAHSAPQNNQDIVKIVDHHTTVLNKPKVMEHLMNDTLLISRADIFDDNHVFRIEFENSKRNFLGAVGQLRMYLTPSGASRIQLVGNFYTNQAIFLTPQESAQILQSASNYPKGSELDKIFNP